jgi:transcriptional regulator with GAF, ATPase, and Fis domain
MPHHLRSFWDRMRPRKSVAESELRALTLPSPGNLPEDDPLKATSGGARKTPFVREKVLYAFVDLKDPFVAYEVFNEPLPGPVLSILASMPFDEVVLFHTPHTVEQTRGTRASILEKFPGCRIVIKEIPASDPKDYSILMGSLSRFIRDRSDVYQTMNFVCASSGTAEMRAVWFLLKAINVLPATLLQVGSPAHPLFGPANVKEVRLGSPDWMSLRDLAMPWEYHLMGSPLSADESSGARTSEKDRSASETPAPETQHKATASAQRGNGVFKGKKSLEKYRLEIQSSQHLNVPDEACLTDLDNALLELNLHVGSASLRYAAEQAAIAAESTLPILLIGETGTGKERFAHLIHRLSTRATKQLIPVNCAAIPASLAETYLLGHMKGAFSGATSDKPGIFEAADDTTLFLDEIAELPLDIQAKLLRVIQDGVVQRIGSSQSRRVDVRILAATNRDLKKEVTEGRFREDLYFRLEVIHIRLPSLRERCTEIPELALTLLKQINQRRQRPRQLSKDALRRLECHIWPGNIRELSNVLERSVLYSRTDVLEPADLLIENAIAARDSYTTLPIPSPGFSVEGYLAESRKQLFLRALAAANNNQAEAAALLGISKQAVNKFVSGLGDNQG